MNRNIIIGILAVIVIIVLAVAMFNGTNKGTTVDTSNAPPILDTGEPTAEPDVTPDAAPISTP